jgi:uncharacterized OB-fold protein
MKEIPFTIASFNRFLSERRLMASRCSSCGALWLPPRPICLTCKDDTMEWKEVSGKGTLVAFTVIGVGPMPMIEAGYGRDKPYCVGIVQVAEGPRIGAQILGVDVAHPENIKIGTPLTVDFVERGSWHFVEEIAKARKTYLAFRA